MPAIGRILLIGALFSSGCRLAELSTINSVNETRLVHNNIALRHDVRVLATEAFEKYKASQPDAGCTEDFQKGYIDGYADYLESGGNGAPPAAPPRCYRTNHYLTPEGANQVEQYFHGWQVGAKDAIDSGMRRFMVVRVSTPPVSYESITGSRGSANDRGSNPQLPSNPSVLPGPRPVAPGPQPVPLEPPLVLPQMLPDPQALLPGPPAAAPLRPSQGNGTTTPAFIAPQTILSLPGNGLGQEKPPLVEPRVEPARVEPAKTRPPAMTVVPLTILGGP